jgi:hypothetical protein
MPDYEALINKRTNKRHCSSNHAAEGPNVKQMKLNEVGHVRAGAVISQAALDDLILDYIIEDLQPFSATEKPSFKKLIQRLAPNRTLMSRKTVMDRLSNRADAMKKQLIQTFQNVSYVATTTDCWSAHHRAYLGVTAHWIDNTMTRQSAGLACVRLKGSHTFDIIAGALEKIHLSYQLQNKIIKTTTDNGSNFCKAFAVFGTTLPGTLSQEAEALRSEIQDLSDDTESSDEADEWRFHSIADIMLEINEEEAAQYSLPPHQRCACHTMNLIATQDIATADSDAAYKKIQRATFAKCQALWNKQSRSTLAAEDVDEVFDKRLIVPNQTRWNSTFMAMERMDNLINEKGMAAMNSVCDKLKLPNFSTVEVKFIAEFVKVMKPFAKALNILQCETKSFMAYLLPTLVTLKDKLSGFAVAGNVNVRHCKPLAEALLAGIEQRFGNYFTDKELIAAAIVHPKFKTMWINVAEQMRIGTEHAKSLLEVYMRKTSARTTEENLPAESTAQTEEDDDFFSFSGNNGTSDNAESILATYLANSCTSIVDLCPAMRAVFIELNTALPASAACERMFSVGGRIFRPARCAMSDEHFEQQLLLRMNSKLA